METMNARNKIPGDLVYPLVYGNEEETGLMDNFCGEMEEPYQLAGDLESYMPPELEFANSNSLLYLQNGSKLYAGGALKTKEPTNIERATPECRTPQQLAIYIRAGELLMRNTAQRFLDETSQNSIVPLMARMQRRVVDSADSRKASHDNFGMNDASELGVAKALPEQILSHLTSRSFITGAGYVSEYGSRYAQKVGGLVEVQGYGFYGTMYRIAPTAGTPRIEIRCGDINISDWAARVRIGSTAIALALNQTPLGDRLARTSVYSALIEARDMNELELNEDGTISATPDIEAAVAFQELQAELALSEIEDYTDPLPQELYVIAREVQQFCSDFRSVLNGEATISILADRADWAAKFMGILTKMDRDKSIGMQRDLSDIRAEAADMRYDYIGLSAENGKGVGTVYGQGYKLRDRGFFRGEKLSQDEIMKAYLHPPADTRAALRGMLVRNYLVESCNWHLVMLNDNGNREAFRFPDVLQSELSAQDKKRLQGFKRHRP